MTSYFYRQQNLLCGRKTTKMQPYTQKYITIKSVVIHTLTTLSHPMPNYVFVSLCYIVCRQCRMFVSQEICVKLFKLCVTTRKIRKKKLTKQHFDIYKTWEIKKTTQ